MALRIILWFYFVIRDFKGGTVLLLQLFKRVLNVEPQDNFWLIEFEDARNKEKEVRYYDAVMICNGHCRDAIIPEIPGIGSFQGSVSHSCDYRTFEAYKGKRVLIIGAGTSGCDISDKISSVANNVITSFCTYQVLTDISSGLCEL